MDLLAQGMMTLIVDKAMHEECSSIEIRLSYLKERYSALKNAWTRARDKLEARFPALKDKITIVMRLPESLAIANCLKTGGTFSPTSGAALVDIGDFTTDIALYVRDANAGNAVKLKDNVSVLFAGRQILLQPIWDYLRFSRAKLETLFTPAGEDDKKAMARLEAACAAAGATLSQAQKMPEDVRRDLLCLMGELKADKIPTALRNLFDICYLTEAVILKRLLHGLLSETSGNLEINLFGGGSSLIPTGDAFNWDAVLRRQCKVDNRSKESNKLAEGLLFDIDSELLKAASDAEKEAQNYERDDSAVNGPVKPTNDELRRGYIRFLKNAQALKRWEVMDANDVRVNTGRLFNVKKPSGDRDGEIDDDSLWASAYNDAIDFALKGGITNKEVIIALFSYKMAYSSAVAFYCKGRRV
jgi:hypothetical protein